MTEEKQPATKKPAPSKDDARAEAAAHLAEAQADMAEALQEKQSLIHI